MEVARPRPEGGRFVRGRGRIRDRTRRELPAQQPHHVRIEAAWLFLEAAATHLNSSSVIFSSQCHILI